MKRILPSPSALRPLLFSTLELIFGTALTAAAFGLFILPHHFASAGVTGLSAVLVNYLPLTLSQMVLAINLLFLVLGLVYLGSAFTVKTLASSVLFPVLLQIFSNHPLRHLPPAALSVVLAGTLLGFGTGLVLHSGASSGGFAVLGVVLQKKCRIPVAVTMNVTDAAIILVQFLHQTLAQTVYGILVITLCAAVVGLMTAEKHDLPTQPQRIPLGNT